MVAQNIIVVTRNKLILLRSPEVCILRFALQIQHFHYLPMVVQKYLVISHFHFDSPVFSARRAMKGQEQHT